MRLTTNKQLLGDAVNALPTTITAVIAAGLLITLNVTLLWLVFTGA